MSIFDHGTRESLKAAVHVALGSLALLCMGYNMLAYARRRQGHLARNVLVYAALVALEVTHVRHHRVM